ncbi:lysozyme inhibitor LprI family protein [Burkholderia gladioli]|uniref:lysozyme inhibitor LprI family protein n=1 Tax=Burkholderia gladioli TaxID=28095 RepID=UPI0016416EAB|nr:lysozyme inhibitor LprI family protein [Burkholderia gladioli]
MPWPSPRALALLAAALLAAPVAQAIDCRKAASPIERTICADPRLQAADAAMGAAYAATLKAAGDEGIRAMLVASQRRWLLRRDAQPGHLDAVDDGQGPPDEAARHEIVLKAIRDRTRVLSQGGIHNPYQRRLVEVALAQRTFEARYTGGPFAGYQTSCDFLPQAGSYSYGCFGTQRFQHHDRVCSVNQDWASGSVSERREVGRVVNGRLTAVASCSIGGGEAGQACPDDDAKGTAARWPAQLDAEATRNEAPPVPPAPLLDADVGEIDQGWLAACLGDAAYPPR